MTSADPALSDVVRVDVREALLRPDGSTVAERYNTWFVRAPGSLPNGRVVEGTARTLWHGAQAFAEAASNDPLVQALIAIYARGRAQAAQAAPHDLNFVAPQEIVLRRLGLEEAAARPYAQAYCLELGPGGDLTMIAPGFAPAAVVFPPREVLAAPAPVEFGAAALVDVVAANAALLAVLGGFGAGTASGDQVMRALMTHPSWLAPLFLFVDPREPDVVLPKLVLFGDEPRMPPDVAWLFSDRAHAEHANAQLVAQGGQLGPYADGVSGVEVFRRMAGQRFQKLNVNIGSPVAETFFVGEKPGDLLALWANAIGLEQVLSSSREPDDPRSLEAFRAFPGVCALEGPDGVATLEKGGTLGLAAFTAVDCANAYLETLPSSQRGAYSRITPSGQALLQHALDRTGGCLFVNPAGPGPKRTLQAG